VLPCSIRARRPSSVRVRLAHGHAYGSGILPWGHQRPRHHPHDQGRPRLRYQNGLYCLYSFFTTASVLSVLLRLYCLYYCVCTVCTTASVLSLLLRLHCLYYYSSDDGVAWPPWSSMRMLPMRMLPMRMLPMRMLPHMSQALHTHAHTNTHAHTHTQREREREATTHTHTLTHSHTHTLTHSLTHARAHTHTVPGPHADRGSGRQHVQASRSRPKPPKCARLPVLPRIPLPLQLLGSPSRHWCVLCVRACVCACVRACERACV
jgi:hypothetical protein